MEGLGKQWRKEGRGTERAHAQINSRKHEALPCRFACLLGGNGSHLCPSRLFGISFSVSRETRAALLFLHPRPPLLSFSKQKSPLWWPQPEEENSILSAKFKVERKEFEQKNRFSALPEMHNFLSTLRAVCYKHHHRIFSGIWFWKPRFLNFKSIFGWKFSKVFRAIETVASTVIQFRRGQEWKYPALLRRSQTGMNVWYLRNI